MAVPTTLTQAGVTAINSQLGDVVSSAQDQGLGPGSTSTVPPLQPQLGLPHPQPGLSGDTPLHWGLTT